MQRRRVRAVRRFVVFENEVEKMQMDLDPIVRQ